MKVKIFYIGETDLADTLFIDPKIKLYEEFENVGEIIDIDGKDFIIYGINNCFFKRFDISKFRIEITA